MNSNKVLAWRTPIALQIVFLLTILSQCYETLFNWETTNNPLVLVPFFPESPRWLAKVGRVDEARRVLKATREGDIEPELRTIVRSVNSDKAREDDNHYLSMIFAKNKTQKELRWRVVLSVWLQIMQELVGIGVITVYGAAS